MEKEIQQLTQLGEAAVQSAISEYAVWFTVSAICWLLFGVACFVAVAVIWRCRKWIVEKYLVGPAVIIGVLLILIGTLTIPINVPTLTNPRAYAIHQLITDAR